MKWTGGQQPRRKTMSKSNESSQVSEEMKLMKELGAMEIRLDLMRILFNNPNAEDAINSIKAYLKGEKYDK